jgi:antitoxin ParD1/3/4
MNISVPPELERLVTEKVASGRYSSASEVVGEALRLLEERDRLRSNQESGDRPSTSDTEIERWLGEEVPEAYDRMQTCPERAIPAEEVFRAARHRHAERGKPSA